MKYLILVEEGPESWGAYVPDLPGCVAVGTSQEEVIHLIHDAVEFHLEGLRESGEPIPEPHSYADYVEVSAA